MCRNITRAFVACLLALLLSACGGGGGGGGAGTSSGSSSSGGGSGSGGSVPQNPPGVPAISYSGSRSTAVLNDESVSGIADSLYSGIVLSLQIADESSSIVLPDMNVIDVNVNGPEGGSAHVTGRVDDAGVGWIQYDLTNFGDRGVTWNGTQVFRRIQINNGLQDSLTEVRFIDLRNKGQFGDVTIRGTLTHRSSIEPPKSTVTGTIQFTDNDQQYTYLAQNVEIVRDETLDTLIGGTGRLFRDAYGWVDFSFDSDWHFVDNADFPLSGGPLVATTGTGTYFELESLDGNEVSLRYTTDPSDPPNRAARLVWPQYFAYQTSLPATDPPTADAGGSIEMQTNQNVRMSASYSSHPQSNYVDFDWQLIFRPPGSQADLDSYSAVEPTLNMDRVGRYLYRLTVTDGVRSDSDFVALSGVDQTLGPIETPAPHLPPDTTAATDEVVTIDVRDPKPNGRSFAYGNVGFVTPDSSHQPVDVGDDGETTFQQSSPGVYVDYLVAQGHILDYQSIAVEANKEFLPTLTFEIPADAGPATLGDVDGDGLDDLVFSYTVSDGPNEVAIYLANGTGFEDPILLEGGEAGTVQIADVSSDGLPDIVTGIIGGIETYLQNPDGSFSAGTILGNSCGIGWATRPIIVADVNNDGRNDVVSDGSCRSTYEVYPQLSDGGLGSAEEHASPTGHFSVAAGDLNGDSIQDLVLGSDDGSDGTPNVRILNGNADGTLGPPQYVGSAYRQDGSPVLVTGDLNGDGRDDLIYTVREQPLPHTREIHVLLQNEMGALVEYQVISPGVNIIDMMLADIDSDGRSDLMIIAVTNGQFVYFQQADGTLSDPPWRSTLQFPGESFVLVESAGDINGDGATDFIRTSGGESALLLLGID